MTATLRDRAEHAAKYGANLVVAATEIKQLLDERDQAQEWADEQWSPLVMRQGEILTGVADALNGPTPPLTSWSHHDLAEKAETLVATLDAVRQLLETADRHQNAFIQTGHLRTALDAAALAEGADER